MRKPGAALPASPPCSSLPRSFDASGSLHCRQLASRPINELSVGQRHSGLPARLEPGARSRAGGGQRTWSSWRRRPRSPAPPAKWCRRRQKRLCLRARGAAEARRSACARGWSQCLHAWSRRAATCARERCKALACQTGAAARTQCEHHVKGLGPVVLVDGVRDRGAVLRLACGARIAVSTNPAAQVLRSAEPRSAEHVQRHVMPKLVQDARCHSGSLESCCLQEGRTVDDRQHQAAQREERRAQRAEQVELLRTRAARLYTHCLILAPRITDWLTARSGWL